MEHFVSYQLVKEAVPGFSSGLSHARGFDVFVCLFIFITFIIFDLKIKFGLFSKYLTYFRLAVFSIVFPSISVLYLMNKIYNIKILISISIKNYIQFN